MAQQSFHTQPVVNTRMALYALSIRNPDAAQSNYKTYIFPISPARITRSFTAMSNIFDTAGSQQENGVHREIDSYGQAPPTFLLEGTTGWQRHQTDGGALTGIESVIAVYQFLAQFAALNTAQVANNAASLYTMELYDYFEGTFWQVAPVGEQRLFQDKTQPLLYNYAFRLPAIRNLGVPPAPTPDPVLTAFSTPPTQALASLQASVSLSLNSYAATAGVLLR
jgi:hypothetical protein